VKLLRVAIMNGPNIIMARPIATIFGRKDNVASLIWVTAWINETTNPTANPTISGGPPSFIVTIMHSRIIAATSISLMVQIGIFMMS
jgi:hypothetical protein